MPLWFDSRLGTHVSLETTSRKTPPLMYAGIRGQA